MNKLFTKIAALALGAAMVVGVGVSVGSKSKVSSAHAAADSSDHAFTTDTVTFSLLGLSNEVQYTGDFTNAADINTFKVNFTGGGNDGKYYNTGTGIRTYGGGSVTVTALNSNTLTQVVFTFSGSSNAAPSNNISGYTLSGAVGTWTGSESSITLTRASGSGHWRLQSVKVTVGSGSTTPLDKPTLTKSNDSLTWTSVSNVGSYELTVDGTVAYTGSSLSYNLTSAQTAQGHHTASVVAKPAADDTSHSDSAAGTTSWTVFDHAGTLADPYSVADARVAIDGNTGITDVYVTGVVTAIQYTWTSSNGITFTIGETSSSTDVVKIFKCKLPDQASLEAIQVGDTVVMNGTLTKYNTEYEIETGCTLVSRTPAAGANTITFDSNGGTDPESVTRDDGQTFIFPGAGSVADNIFKGWSSDNGSTFYQEGDTSPEVDGDITYVGYWQTKGTSSDPYTVTEALAAITANTGIKSACVSGIVSQVGSLSSGALTYYISADGQTTNQLEVYKGKGLNGASFSAATDLPVGTSVVVQGNLKDYNGTKEFDSNSVILSIVEKFEVTYYSNGATSGTAPTDSNSPYNNGSIVTVLTNSGNLAKTGFTFNGWNTAADGSGTHYAVNAQFTISATVDLYAEWTFTLDAITSISGTVSGKTVNAGSYNWDFSGLTVYGTISSVTNQDVTSYVDLSSTTAIPSSATSSMVVSVTATKKSSISGSATSYTDSESIIGSVESFDNDTQLVPGNYYIKYQTHYFTGTITSGAGATSTEKANGMVFTFTLVGDNEWEITNGDNYLGIGSGSTSLSLSSTQSSLTIGWYSEQSGTRYIRNATSNRQLAWYSSNSTLRTYASSTADETHGMTLESAKTISSFTVDSTNANKNVLKGSTFDAAAAAAAGFVAKLNYTDSTFDDVTSFATWTLDTSVSNNNATLTVTYESYTAVEITGMNVYAAVLTSLTIDASGAKTSGYWTGDALDTTGLVITGKDSSNNSYNVAINDCTFSPSTLTTAGESVQITATYTNENETTATGTYSVSVAEFAYEVATSINGGDKIIFATDSEHSSYMSSINSKNYGDVTEYTDKPGTEHTYTVVAGSQDGTVAFKNSSGQYLNGSTAKALSLTSTISDATSWTVSFNDEVPTITNVSTTTNVLKYNASSPRIAAYANTNSIFLNIYKLKGTSGQSVAEGFADLFNELVVDEVCAVNDSSFDEQMPTAWELIASDYDDISAEAKAYIASKSANASGDDVEKMLYEYKHIYETYGSTLSLSNFLGRTEVTKAALVKLPNTQLLGEANATTIIIIVSVIGVSALGGFFFLRKRKEI